MSRPLLIFCAADFISALNSAFPGALIYPFATNVANCRIQVAELDQHSQRQVILLYQTTDIRAQNEIVTDHINLSMDNPLIGPANLDHGARFPDMSAVYKHQNEGVIAVFGQDPALDYFKEDWVSVTAGVWEAIALKHRGYLIQAWIVADIEKWIIEQS